jgi:hypothetical protein
LPEHKKTAVTSITLLWICADAGDARFATVSLLRLQPSLWLSGAIQ